MSWSLGETSALALKATRGAGLSWGLAEEAAGAVAWLHERGLPGIAALCSYLDTIVDAAPPRGTGDAACPLLTGSALSDGTIAAPSDAGETLDLGRVLSPLLLLPFVASLRPGTMWLQPGKFGQENGRPPDRWQAQWLRGEAVCQVVRGNTPQIGPAGTHHMRTPEQFGCCIERLTHFAHRTYAPATSASRLSGAGAGLTDND
ncbi:MAG: DUF3726 domain-containing protein [Pseudomonadota bacterium]|nr:DUF3726 domain-containing protein [Pseudomonadota bacterium]MEC8130289.1 DUF3726 domain-containing protein [Pseudomonadota bacterium]